MKVNEGSLSRKERKPITQEVSDRIHAAQQTAFDIALAAGKEGFYRYAEGVLKAAQDRAFKEQDGYELSRGANGKVDGVKKLSDGTVYLVASFDEYTPTGQLKHAVPMPACFCPHAEHIDKINAQLVKFGFDLRVSCKHHRLRELLENKEAKGETAAPLTDDGLDKFMEIE